MTSPEEKTLLLDRVRGTMLGCALGDAIGLFTEFLSRGRSVQTYGQNPRFSLAYPIPEGEVGVYRDFHRGQFPRSGWTDDTDQAILILLSFLRSGGSGVDVTELAARFRSWMDGGLKPLNRQALDIGNTVGSVITHSEFLDDPHLTAWKIWDERGRHMAANGAVMRTGVVGALFFQDKDSVGGIQRTMEAAISIGALTHADPRCLISCAIASALVAASIRNELHSTADLDKIVQKSKLLLASHDPPLEQGDIDDLDYHLSRTSLDELKLDDRGAIGYTYKCLGSGVWALRQALLQAPKTAEEAATLFDSVIAQITMRGGDADTNCAVAGSLLGAHLSYSSLPPRWLENLRDKQWLLQKIDEAASLLGLIDTPYDYNADPDTLI